MFQVVLLSAILAAATASPGNLGLSFGNSVGAGSLGYGPGFRANQVTVASGSASVAAPVVAATPAVAAVPTFAVAPPVAVVPSFVAAPVAVTPFATSSHSRVDIINPRQILTQVAATIPAVAGVNGGLAGPIAGSLEGVAAGYGAAAGYGTAAEYGTGVNAGLRGHGY